MSQLSYDAVIATRNRPEALTLSLPLLLGQSRPPARLIVIDASDDHAAAAQAVAQATQGYDGEVIVEAAPAGLTAQRNRGLAHVTAPVVFFPDDDSLFCPSAAAAILTVYERDHATDITAVCASEAAAPSAGTAPDASYEMSHMHRREARFRGLRTRLQRRLAFLKPAQSLGRELNARRTRPGWLEAADAVPVDYMTGFRMTFRTEVIRAHGFDETLAAYGLEEDVDASFSAMREGLVVAARRAQIYHHRVPGGRGDAWTRGHMEVFNRAHVLLKHASGPLGSAVLTRRVWRWHLGFTATKLLIGLAGVHRSAGRARLRGALAGHRMAMKLWRGSLPLSSAPVQASLKRGQAV